jgi:DNA-directed RNA polymerase subunit K/omega
MRAASFKSLYQKRPSKTMHLRTVAWRALQIQH